MWRRSEVERGTLQSLFSRWSRRLLRISTKWTTSRQKLCDWTFCLPWVGVNGKRKLNFSVKLNGLTRRCLRSTPRSLFFTLSFCFSSEVWIPGRLVVPRHPRRAIRASALSLGGTFPRGKSLCLHLGSALKWWTSETRPLFVCSPLISEAERCGCCCCRRRHPASPRYLSPLLLPPLSSASLSSSPFVPPSVQDLKKLPI